jgi:hypothetical protein
LVLQNVSGISFRIGSGVLHRYPMHAWHPLSPASPAAEDFMTLVKPDNTQDSPLTSLVDNLGELIRQARLKALRAVDTAQVQTCWQIGRHIVEFEQEGARRAGMGSSCWRRWPKP